jgi:type IV secretory pathway protease TraF
LKENQGIMRRIDAIAIGLAIFLAGGGLYLLLQVAGLDSQHAGIWSQAVLVGGLVVWLATYLFRVGGKKMTYHQQVREYEDAVLQKRLEEMSPEDLEKLQAEIEADAQKS